MSLSRRMWAGAITALMIAAIATSVEAHTPHDVILTVAPSPAFDSDRTVFVITRGRLLRSVLGGYGWKELANGLENDVETVTVSPDFAADGAVFVTSKQGDVYRSEDRGWSWERLEDAPDGARFLLASSATTLVAVGVDGGLSRSADGGATWEIVLGSEAGITTSASGPEMWVVGGAGGGIWSSHDDGATWARVAETGAVISALSILDEVVVVGSESGALFRVSSAGAVEPVENVGAAITSIAAHRGRMVASTRHGVLASADGGCTWGSRESGITRSDQADKFVVPHFRNVVSAGETLFVAGFDGLFKSDDHGETWRHLETFTPRTVMSLSTIAEPGRVPTLGMTTYWSGVFITHDAGDTWRTGNAGLRIPGRLSDVAFSPAFPEDGTVFTMTNEALYVSADAGAHWERTARPPYSNVVGKAFNRFVHAVRRGRLSTCPPFPIVVELSPSFAEDETVFLGTRYVGVFKSVDRGRTWTRSLDRPVLGVRSIAASPTFDEDRTVFVNVVGEGVFRTTDAGETWDAVSDGLEPDAPGYGRGNCGLAVAPDGTTVFVTTPTGLYRTRDAGATWSLTPFDLRSGQAFSVLGVSPAYSSDGCVLVGVRGHGLFRSRDGGIVYEPVGEELIAANHDIEHMAFSPNFETDQLIFAASREEVFVSSDGGSSWSHLSRPTRHENVDDAVTYTGRWRIEEDEHASMFTRHASNTPGDRIVFEFVGTGFRWVGSRGPDHGSAEVVLDGTSLEVVDAYADERVEPAVVFEAPELAAGLHEIVITVAEPRGNRSSRPVITVDAFEIDP